MTGKLRGFLFYGVTLSILVASVQSSGTNRFTEDFTTKLYCDQINTTAHWDTVAGELKLFPFVPTLIGNYDTPDRSYCVAVSGDYAFVADGTSGLQVIDISDPSNPTLLGNFNTPGDARSVAVAGDHAFVADYVSGLQVIDISDPTNLTLAGSYDTPGFAHGVTIAGDRAFVADGISGLQVIDISDPTNPSPVGTYNTPGNAIDVTVSGDHAFLADLTSGLQVIDISDPANPMLVGTYNTPGRAWGVSVSGDHAFLADDSYGLQVIDISDPANPTLAGSYDTSGNAYGVTVSGDHAFVADYASGLQVIDISDPSNPTLECSYDTPGHAYGVAISGCHAYVADYYSGLQVIDICDSTNPTLRGNYDTPGSAYGVVVSGDRAFVANSYSGLTVIDISEPTNPAFLGNYATPGQARAVAVSGEYAFVAVDTFGLQVIDISDPTDPMLLGTYDTPGRAQGVAVSGDHAFVTDFTFGLQVIDISDPTDPTLLGSYDTPGGAYDIAVSGEYAFMADGGSLQVIDISDPTNPTLLGYYYTMGGTQGVVVSGEYAFVTEGSSGLEVIDISDPTDPTLLGNCDTPGYARGVAVSGEYAFVADHTFGLQVIDISDPADPTLFSNYASSGYAYGVAVSGDYAFAMYLFSGLHVIQVYQSEVDSDRNEGWSLLVDGSSDSIFGVRLMTTQTESVAWELSADGGVNWQGMIPDGNWNWMTAAGTDLLWRSTLSELVAEVSPVVTDLQIEWLGESALIDSIVDVPGDQGGEVLAHFTMSGRDFPEATLPISNYGIWRRVDSEALVAALETQVSSMAEKSIASDTPELGNMPVISFQGQTYVQSRPDLASSSFPPGTWALVITVPAIQQDAYIAALPTSVDSSASGANHTVFVLTAHTTTPSVWYVSEPDSGYSVDNIAPGVPLGMMVAYNTGSGNEISWDDSPEVDFQYYRVYRGDEEGFVPGPANLAHETASPSWNDPDFDGWEVYYKVTALDHVGNESDAASPGSVTGDDLPSIPKSFALYQNVPNPFNPSTIISFDLPYAAHVRLRVFNVKGELVATILDRGMEAGRRAADWDGTDRRGGRVASGIYFYMLEAGDFTHTRKMVMLR